MLRFVLKYSLPIHFASERETPTNAYAMRSDANTNLSTPFQSNFFTLGQIYESHNAIYCLKPCANLRCSWLIALVIMGMIYCACVFKCGLGS